MVARTLLESILTTTNEKIVIVSNYTKTLDVISKMMDKMVLPATSSNASSGQPGVRSFRLDGTTHVTEREGLVNRFNSASCPVRYVVVDEYD